MLYMLCFVDCFSLEIHILNCSLDTFLILCYYIHQNPTDLSAIRDFSLFVWQRSACCHTDVVCDREHVWLSWPLLIPQWCGCLLLWISCLFSLGVAPSPFHLQPVNLQQESWVTARAPWSHAGWFRAIYRLSSHRSICAFVLKCLNELKPWSNCFYKVKSSRKAAEWMFQPFLWNLGFLYDVENDFLNHCRWTLEQKSVIIDLQGVMCTYVIIIINELIIFVRSHTVVDPEVTWWW